MNIVTGANGLVGAHVLLALAKRGLPVTGTHRKNADLSEVQQFFERWDGKNGALFKTVHWTELDILDITQLGEVLQQASCVYHCAGYVSFEQRDRSKLMKVNEQGTANIVNLCLQYGVRLCHVSSVAVFHNLDVKTSLNEEVYWKKSGRESVYAISKYNAEREVWRGIEEGLQAVIVNPGVILPMGFWKHSSAKVFETIYKGNPFYTPGNAAYVAATEVAEVMVQLVEAEAWSERFIVAEGNYGYREIFACIAENLGKKAPKFAIPKPLLMLGARLETAWAWIRSKPARFSPDLVHSAFNSQEYSTKKLKNRLNFEFTPTPEVLAEAAKYYLIDRKKPKKA